MLAAAAAIAATAVPPAAAATPASEPTPPASGTERETLLFAYEMLILRQQTQANLLWQTPSLALTAQAFLLTIALSADASSLGRIFAACLGIVVALISMHTMVKHRHFENLDNFKMARLERQLGLPPLSTRSWKDDPPVPGGRPVGQDNWRTKLSSYEVWQAGIALFAIINLYVIAVEIARLGLFHPATS